MWWFHSHEWEESKRQPAVLFGFLETTQVAIVTFKCLRCPKTKQETVKE